MGVAFHHRAVCGGRVEEVCKYAAKADIPADANSSDPEAAKETASIPLAEPGERDPMDIAIAAMMSLSAVELIEFAAKVHSRLSNLQAAEQLPMAA